MPATTRTNRVPRGQLRTATALLIGILAIAYGWFRPSKAGLYAGLIIAAGGVLSWVVLSIVHGGGDSRRS